ncbi:MAG: methyltransferase domain-containing protein [Thermodesulfovibrio sp.]|nr:methyltransferase domain-containing protein [Thermodesulfovibrio sp.]
MNPKYREKIYRKYVEILTKYSEKPNDNQEYKKRKKLYNLNYKKFLPSNRESKILELGCGKGFFLKYLKEMGYSNILGIEKSESQILHALSDIKNYIVEDDMFNYLQNCSIEYDMIVLFDEILELLELIHKRLSNKGILIIEVHNASSPLFGSFGRYSDFTHEVGFTPLSLRQLLLTYNYVDIEVHPVKGVSPYARIFFLIVNRILHSRFTRHMFIEGEIYGVGKKK